MPFQRLLFLTLLSSITNVQSDHRRLRLNREVEKPASSPLEWSYENIEEWTSLAEICGSGQRQSPIVIDPESALQESYPPFELVNYDVTFPIFMTNEAGHSLRLYLCPDIPMEELPSIRGGGLKDGDNYTFAQIHFHWGNDLKEEGSEHIIGSHQYPAEMHMVHFNQKYGSVSEAVNHEDGLAVLGVLIKKVPRGRVHSFGRLLNFVDSVREKDSTVSLPNPFPLQELLPESIDSFYRYSGSLTTPGCQESVTWTVFDTPITISRHQLLKFQLLLNENGGKLINNHRPTQPIKNRTVYYRPGNTRMIISDANDQSNAISSS